MTQTARQKPLIPAYLIVGEDALKRSTVLRRLRERLAQYGDLSFNSDTFDGETALGADIVSACNTMPFASEKRLVYVRDVDKLKKADSEELIAYLDSPSDQTVLALEAEKLAKIDYVSAVDAVTMESVHRIDRPVLVAMAVYIGKTRLIDNFLTEDCAK